VVTLPEKLNGPRYDHLQGLKCEIQVRTVLQDAWAIIDHHLRYKGEQLVAKGRRGLYRLAALLEDMDASFQELRDAGLIDDWEDPKNILGRELVRESFKDYLEWEFRGYPIANSSSLFEVALDLFMEEHVNYRTIRDVHELVKSTEEERENLSSRKKSGVAEILAALGLRSVRALYHPLFPPPLREEIIHAQPRFEGKGG
jgi:hypothetical protein